MDKLKTLSDHLPKEIPAEHAQRKVLKIIAGVLMHESEEKTKPSSEETFPQKTSLEETSPEKGSSDKTSSEERSPEDCSPDDRTRKLDEAIRLGYAYGLTYPLIDDLLDSKVLSLEEKNRYSSLPS